MKNKFEKAISLFDKANTEDPNKETFNGVEYSKELLYAMRMTSKLESFMPNASETLKLAVRSQHICRWEIPRSSFEMNRVGYLTWRKELNKFHADKAAGILENVGYKKESIAEVKSLLLKRNLAGNNDAQTLEDVVCLVFLEFSLAKFSKKYSEEKLIDIIKKTWNKMSDEAHKEALLINLDDDLKKLISRAID